jgi:hypothetical protein
MSPADILAVVDDQFGEIRKQLDTQVTRTAQVQAETDRLRKDSDELRQQLANIHALVKTLIKAAV